MLFVAIIGVGVNAAGAWLLDRGSGESLAVKSAYLDVLGDTLGELGVMTAAVLVLTLGWRLADPVVAGAIAIVIIPRTWGLLRQAVNVLLEGTPSHLNLEEIGTVVQGVLGVVQVHDLHIWTLTSGKYAMSGHVEVETIADTDRILRDLHTLLHERFGIEHTTIQVESRPMLQITSKDREPKGSEPTR